MSDYPPDVPGKSNAPKKNRFESYEPKESDTLRIYGKWEDWNNIRTGWGGFHFFIDIKTDLPGGKQGLLQELKKMGATPNETSAVELSSPSFPDPLPRGTYVAKYWQGRKGKHGELMSKSKYDEEVKGEH